MYKYIIALSTITIFLLMGCEDELNKNHKIDPGTQAIEGPDSIYANPDLKNEFVALARAGSKYEWTVIKGALIIEPNTTDPFKANISSEVVETTDSATIQVVETTLANVKSLAGTKTIKILKYCDFNIANFMGTFKVSRPQAGGSTDAVVSLDTISKTNDSTIIIRNLPELKTDIEIVFNPSVKRTIRIVNKTYYADGSESNEYTYKGSGTYNSCTQRFNLTFDVYFQGDKKNILSYSFYKYNY
jgi:hypothetical protein